MFNYAKYEKSSLYQDYHAEESFLYANLSSHNFDKTKLFIANMETASKDKKEVSDGKKHGALAYLSNHNVVWTNEDPHVELIEPPLLVSINRNWLQFGRRMARPAFYHNLMIVNHGDTPIAFKIHTSDNYAYFVNKVMGIVPGRRIHALPHIRMNNSVTVQVYRKPYTTFADEEQVNRFNTPRKDRLFIFVAPVQSFATPPAQRFHGEAAYEKLRVCLEYTGVPDGTKEPRAFLKDEIRGWNTWDKQSRKAAVENKAPKISSAESGPSMPK